MDWSDRWLLAFVSVVSINEHPGSGRGDSVKKSIAECATVADKCMVEFYRRFPSWQDGQQQSPPEHQ